MTQAFVLQTDWHIWMLLTLTPASFTMVAIMYVQQAPAIAHLSMPLMFPRGATWQRTDGRRELQNRAIHEWQKCCISIT